MFQRLQHRGVHYFVLILSAALLTLPQIGRTSLWDDDEALNAEAAREMFETGEWITPTFNYRLRDAKPVLLYWCQSACYRVFGISEFAARLPSAVAYIALGLLVYELGRRMFSATIGLLAAVLLQSSAVVVWLGGFASHDALLLTCTALTFLCFWCGYAPRHANESPRNQWFIPVGCACGLGMLAKGPVAIVLPVSVIVLFLIWERQLSLLWTRRALYGLAACWLVAAPWYILVTVATRGAFARGFFITNNYERLHTPMEMHGGSVFFHPLVFLLGFAPWSLFLLPAAWHAIRQPRATTIQPPDATRPARRLLVCWVSVYMLFFCVVATKLPHYTAPLYPAVALLLAHFLGKWWHRETSVPRFVLGGACSLLALAGIALATGSLWFGHSPLGTEAANTLADWSWIGIVALALGIMSVLGVYTDRRRLVVAGMVVVHWLDLLVIGQGVVPALDRHKAVPLLVERAGTQILDQEIRLGSYQYSQPSIVFYSQREVRQIHSEAQAAEFLAAPLPAYLFIADENWRRVQPRLGAGSATVVARRFDLFRRREIVVVSNRPDATAWVAQRSRD